MNRTVAQRTTAIGLWPLLLLASCSCLPASWSAPSVEITEIDAAGGQRLRDEDGDTPDWVEIQNRSSEPADLAGWVLSEQSHHTRNWSFPATNLPPGGFLVLFASGKDRRVPGLPLHANFKLPAQGGTLVLRGPSGELSRIDNYPQQIAGVSFGLARGAGPGPDQSAPAGADSKPQAPPPELRTPVYLAAPTPGRSNSAAVWPGPSIEWVAHQPSGELNLDQPISVRAKVAPLNGSVAEVRLSYRVMFGSETELPMYDDGQHGDGAAGDGVFGASIPAKVAKAGQMIRYCVLAKDSSARRSRWPLFANRPDYSAYQGTVVAESAIQTRLPVLHLFTGRDQRLSQRVDRSTVTLFYQGELYDNVEMAAHGQITRSFPKQSYNLHFPHDHHFLKQTNQARVHGLTLMANFADKSKIRNTLAYEMIAASGSLGHFAFPIRVQMNGKFFSVAEVIEKGDERWLERVHRDPQGALYKMNNNLSSARAVEKKTRKYEDNRDLASFARALSEQRPIDDRAAYAYDNVDLPQCISYLVAMALISSDDHGHKNYYLYRDSRHSGEWALLPWDVDLSWGRNWTGEYFNETVFVDNPLDLYRDGRQKARNRLYNLLFQYPEFRQMYLRRLRTVMDELLQPPDTPPQSLIIENRVRELMDLVDPPAFKPSDAALDTAKWPSWGNPSSMREEAQRIIKVYLPGRRQFLFKSQRAKLNGEPIPPPQPADAALAFNGVEAKAPQVEQSICITNRNDFAVDISGWQVKGCGVEHRFRPGTVIPSARAIYLVADTAVFRGKRPSPRAPLFVQGNWTGHLTQGPGTMTLLNKAGRAIARQTFP